ncbi:MAG: hypothetical protein OEZ04_01925 [Nitrospinota bacterium]|nr:hypothetical protein [Nitrospinota bacterium]
MELKDRGEVRILSVPVGAEGSGRVVEYLLKFSKNPTKDRPKVNALIQKLPAVMARGVSRRNGEKIVAALAKLGAKAVFHQEGAANDTDYSGQPSADGGGLPQHNQEQEPVSATSRRRKAPGTNRRNILALVAILLLAGAAYQQGYLSPSKDTVTTKPRPSRSTAPIATQPYVIPKGDLLEYYDKEHAPYFDRRLADGLAEAVREYARLFPRQDEAEKVDVSYQPEQTGVDDWRLVYSIKTEGTVAQVEALLSTDPDRVTENIPALSKALTEAVEEMKGAFRPTTDISIERGDSKNIFRTAMSELNNKSIIDGLSKLGNTAGPESVEPGALLAAGDLLSWLAYIKSAHDRPNQNQIVAPYAVANHLLASLFIKEENRSMARSRGLLWMGLGYPAAALKAISGQPKPGDELVSVMAMRDVDRLPAAGKKARASRKLLAYLDARLTREFHTCQSAAPKYDFLIENYPMFLFGKEFTIICGSVDQARRASGYASLVGTMNMTLTMELLEVSPAASMPMIGTTISMLTGETEDMQEGLLKIQKVMLESSLYLKEKEKILTRNLIVDYLGEENKDAVYLCFQAEKNVYSRLEKAKYWADLIGKVWPDSSIAHLTAMAYERKIDNYGRSAALVKKVALGSAGRRLLEEVVEFYMRKGGTTDKIGQTAMALGALRLKTDPTPAALKDHAYLYKWHYYHLVSQDYYQRAKKMDPYNPLNYWNKFRNEDEKLLAEESNVLLKSSTFLWSVARWMKDEGRIKEAIQYYILAMGLATDSSIPTELAEMYMGKKEYAKAEAVMKEFLKGDDGSFTYVHGKNTLAEIYLAQGKAKKAFDLMEKNKESWQGGTLDLYAQAAEALGKMDLAEDYFIKAADRYQSSSAPVDLALYYLRQGDRNKAVGALKRYRKYNHHTYYFKRVIRQLKKNGTPEDIISIVTDVEGKKADRDIMRDLYDNLMAARLYGLAAQMARSMMTGTPAQTTYDDAVNYVKAIAKKDPSNTQAALDEALEVLSVDKRRLLGFAMHLHQAGYYKEALAVFPVWGDAIPGRRDDGTVMMAVSWKADGGKDLKMKKTIEARLQAPDVDQWKSSLARYYLGQTPEAELLASMTDSKKAVQSIYAMALNRLAEGETESAEKLMVMTLETRMSRYLVCIYAYNYLREATNKADKEV